MARQIVYRNAGPAAEVLEVVEGPEPGEPAPGRVLVRVTRFAVHPGDLHGIERPHPVPEGGMTPGIEAAGVVEAAGAGIPDELAVGSRVGVFPHDGTWQQFVEVPASIVVPVPAGVSDDVAAQMLANPIAAVLLAREAERHVTPGWNAVVLQSAAGSSVGRLVPVAAGYRHLAMINLVRSAESARALEQRFPGVPAVPTDRDGWKDTVRAHAAGHQVLAAIDPVGGILAAELLDLLSPDGTLVVYGAMAAGPIPVSASAMLNGTLGIRGVSVRRWLSTASPEARARHIADALLLAKEAPGQFGVAGRYPLTQLTAAVGHAARPGKTGTVLVEIQ